MIKIYKHIAVVRVVIDKKGNGHKIEAVELMSYNRNKKDNTEKSIRKLRQRTQLRGN